MAEFGFADSSTPKSKGAAPQSTGSSPTPWAPGPPVGHPDHYRAFHDERYFQTMPPVGGHVSGATADFYPNPPPMSQTYHAGGGKSPGNKSTTYLPSSASRQRSSAAARTVAAASYAGATSHASTDSSQQQGSKARYSSEALTSAPGNDLKEGGAGGGNEQGVLSYGTGPPTYPSSGGGTTNTDETASLTHSHSRKGSLTPSNATPLNKGQSRRYNSYPTGGSVSPGPNNAAYGDLQTLSPLSRPQLPPPSAWRDRPAGGSGGQQLAPGLPLPQHPAAGTSLYSDGQGSYAFGAGPGGAPVMAMSGGPGAGRGGYVGYAAPPGYEG